ncbi:dihydropteroate synthase [Methanolinea mesophila]|uniref:dihydropteroate synthase n=1 Tax=Methanolinea mesophila TaxID=547055 RepID=UPI001AE5A071|nr:dihydropteroate synthase [Methanolinea mesophila]MBP1929479.1 dihydropteroate synthase [Methanolinea mesophila]
MFPCRVNGMAVGGGAPVRLMGVINCSPESFFSGSFTRPADVRSRAEAMTDAGADIIDLGARSTAPGSPAISVAEETERITRALSELDGSGITVSVDTRYPEVLDACLSHDLHAVNDIGGFSTPGYAAMAAGAGLPAILMAACMEPGDALGVEMTVRALQEIVTRCEDAGVKEYVLDPGIGLWTPARTVEMDWELCRNFSRFREFDRPLLAAISRKTFLRATPEQGPEARLPATLGMTALLLRQGADMVRAHDVAETAEVIRVVSRMNEHGV